MVGILPTERFNAHCLKLFYDQLYFKCPMYRLNDHTIWKNASNVLVTYLSYLINNKMGQGYCPFHQTNIATRDDIDTCNDSNLKEKRLGIKNGDHFVWYKKLLAVTLTGDGGPVKNATRMVDHLVVLMLQILGLGVKISQSIYCGACVMISQLSESDSKLTSIIRQVGNTLPNKGNLAIKCSALNIWVCIPYKRFRVADWKFTFTHFNLSVGVTGDFALIEICIWKNGIPCGIHKKQLYECLMMQYIDPWTDPGFEYCQNTKFNGLLLSNKYVLQKWGKEVDNLVNIQKRNDANNNNLEQWNDPKYERKERVRLAQKVANPPHGVLSGSDIAYDAALVDMAHGFWSFMGLCCVSENEDC